MYSENIDATISSDEPLLEGVAILIKRGEKGNDGRVIGSSTSLALLGDCINRLSAWTGGKPLMIICPQDVAEGKVPSLKDISPIILESDEANAQLHNLIDRMHDPDYRGWTLSTFSGINGRENAAAILSLPNSIESPHTALSAQATVGRRYSFVGPEAIEYTPGETQDYLAFRLIHESTHMQQEQRVIIPKEEKTRFDQFAEKGRFDTVEAYHLATEIDADQRAINIYEQELRNGRFVTSPHVPEAMRAARMISTVLCADTIHATGPALVMGGEAAPPISSILELLRGTKASKHILFRKMDGRPEFTSVQRATEAARELLNGQDIEDPLIRHILQGFVSSVEFLAPELAGVSYRLSRPLPDLVQNDSMYFRPKPK